MNSTLTLKLTTVSANTVKPSIFAQARRVIACKWDMAAVISLLLSSAAYSVHALTQMTGF